MKARRTLDQLRHDAISARHGPDGGGEIAQACSTLNACVHSLWRKPGMHQSMHSGSIARAAVAPPRSSVSQPNCSRMPVTVCLAAASLPQMNIVGRPAANFGLTIFAFPTELNALTKRACGQAF